MNQTLFKLVVLMLISLSLTSYSPEVAAKTEAKTAGQQTGTWENKNEDGDGVPDEQDDYPFDATKSEYELVYEKEFNNHLAVANSIKDGVPFRVNGAIQQKLDIDLFKFNSVGRKAVTVILKSENSDFVPYVTILNKSGESLTPVPTNFSPVGRVRYAVTFTLATDGIYYLVVNDEQRRGAPEYSYQVHVFEDIDVDGLDDSLESAYGFSNFSTDTDHDRIFDANEFYVYEYDDVLAHDIDKDGVPNWLDNDSDDDGILDRVEGIFDFDHDGFASFVDLDSGGNGINDDVEVKDTSMAPRDLDNDRLYDFLDVDDDNDGWLDIHDNDPLNALRVAMPGDTGYKNIVYLSYIYSGDEIHGVQIAGEAHSISGHGLTGSGFLVFDMGKAVPPINMPVTSNSADKINFAMPKGAVNLFFVADGFRSNKVLISYSDEDIPIFNSLNNPYVSEGELVELSGKHFFGDTKVIIGELIIDPTIHSSSKLTFILPSGLPSEIEITLKNSYGKGNSRMINVGKSVVADINAEVINNVDFSKLFVVSLHSPATEPSMFNSQGVTEVIVGSGHDVIIVMYQNEQGKKLPYFYRTAFGEQAGVSLSPLDSAISAAWYKSGIRKRVPASKWLDIYDDIGDLPEVKKLSNYISGHLSNLEYTADSQYLALERAAVLAVTAFGKTLSEKR
ncbi:hypothetical protein ACRWQN_12845 [Shewanella sp. HL-SH8]|uniref:hypothetical protein n=1 Tax=Shewanella sp. HL-SH8 TaxID=3436242 RepID=UPI003EB84E67